MQSLRITMRHWIVVVGVAFFAVAGCDSGEEAAQTSGSTPTQKPVRPGSVQVSGDFVAVEGFFEPEKKGPEQEFDFWLGEWDVQNNHLVDGEWQRTGKAHALIQPVAGGKAVLEQWDGVARSPLHGFSVRTYDDELEKWVIVLNWHGGQPSAFSQMHGNFADDRGEFFPPGDGPKSVRFTFSEPLLDSCKWDQAISQDNGETWNTNWIMEFSRVEKSSRAHAANFPIAQPPESAAAFPNSRQLDLQIGRWSGTAERLTEAGEWQQGEVEVAVSSMIEGLGILRFADYSWNEYAFAALAFDGNRNKWVSVGVNNLEDGFQWLGGAITDDSVMFENLPQDDSPQTRETWSDLSADTVQVVREVSEDGGRTFNTVLRATLERQAEE